MTTLNQIGLKKETRRLKWCVTQQISARSNQAKVNLTNQIKHSQSLKEFRWIVTKNTLKKSNVINNRTIWGCILVLEKLSSKARKSQIENPSSSNNSKKKLTNIELYLAVYKTKVVLMVIWLDIKEQIH